MNKQPIGIFDSGYGGLSIMKEIVAKLPQYDYLYLGDNARSPYGTRSFETVYQYTLESVKWFFENNCSLVILACNTASAKALRSIQQNDLPLLNSNKRVLGVIRPSAEIIGNYTTTNHIGILATTGTVLSNSYPLEIKKFFPNIHVHQQACPLWVPLVENNEYNNVGADFFIEADIKKLLEKSNKIDTILLGCTHYPLLLDKIKKYTPSHIKIISQGEIVANSLQQYLQKHISLKSLCSKGGEQIYCTTDSIEDFNNHATFFLNKNIHAIHVNL